MAFTSSDPWRFRLYAFITERVLRVLPEAELCVAGDDSVPFNKAAALNRAAAKATTDVFYVLDADSWLDHEVVRRCVKGIKADPDRWAHPWVIKSRLDEKTTMDVLEAGRRWDGQVPFGAKFERRNPYWASPPLLLSRMAWDTVGGMDERFNQGWGHEDEAFGFALRAVFGRAIVLSGECIHLWHPRVKRAGDDRWPGQEEGMGNGALAKQYRKAARSRRAMVAFLEGRQR